MRRNPAISFQVSPPSSDRYTSGGLVPATTMPGCTLLIASDFTICPSSPAEYHVSPRSIERSTPSPCVPAYTVSALCGSRARQRTSKPSSRVATCHEPSSRSSARAMPGRDVLRNSFALNMGLLHWVQDGYCVDHSTCRNAVLCYHTQTVVNLKLATCNLKLVLATSRPAQVHRARAGYRARTHLPSCLQRLQAANRSPC